MSDEPQRVVFHVGAPVSSSWLIQKYLRENTRALRKSGTAVLPPEVLGRVVGSGGKLTDEPGGLRQAFVDRSVGASAVLATHDNTVGRAFDDDGRGLYPDAKPTIEALAQATEPWDTTIILTVGPFDSFLETRYLRDVSAGGADTFDDWLAQRDLGSLSWRPLYDTLTSVFGRRRVRVVDERVFDEGRAAFVTEFFRCAALPMPFTVGEPLQSTGGLSAKALDIALAANPFLPRPHDRAELRTFVTRHFSTLDYPPPDLLSADQAHELRERFSADYIAMTDEVSAGGES